MTTAGIPTPLRLFEGEIASINIRVAVVEMTVIFFGFVEIITLSICASAMVQKRFLEIPAT
jgi:hypothetical protein